MMPQASTSPLPNRGAQSASLALAHRRGWRQLMTSTVALKVAGGLFILGSWELIVWAVAPAYVARPTGIVRVLPMTIVSAPVLDGAATTLWAVTQGLAIALVIGTVVGLAMGHVNVIERLLRIYVSGLNAMPMIALLPLLTIWFGFTSAARLSTIVFAAFFPVAMNVTDGARGIPSEYLEVARSYRARPRHIWFGITLPSSLPYLLAGIRVAVARALIAAVVAEFYISVDGLGFYILFQSRTFHHNEAFVAVLMLAGFAILNDGIIGWLTRRFMPWYRAGERGR